MTPWIRNTRSWTLCLVSIITLAFLASAVPVTAAPLDVVRESPNTDGTPFEEPEHNGGYEDGGNGAPQDDQKPRFDELPPVDDPKAAKHDDVEHQRPLLHRVILTALHWYRWLLR